MNTFLYGIFVSPHGGLGGPPSLLACLSISVVVIELWAVEAFVFRLLLLVVRKQLLRKINPTVFKQLSSRLGSRIAE
jgi:hypothetical protein